MKLVKPINFRNIDIVSTLDFMENMKKFKINNNFAVAVSGGPDSLALMLLSNEFARHLDIKMTVICIDHNLRKNSSSEVKWVRSQAMKLGAHFITAKIPKNNLKSNLMSYARDVRYKELYKICSRKKIKVLLTAHHLDDEIENFLMRLVRGSGIKGLSSLKEKSMVNNNKLQLIRPLLRYPKKSLIKYLSSKKQTYICDPTNKDLTFDRSRIRQLSETLIKEGLSKNRLSAVIKNLKNANEAVDELISIHVPKIFTFHDKSKIQINLKKFYQSSEEVQFRILVKLVRFVGYKDKVPRSKSIMKLISEFQRKQFKRSSLNGCQFTKHENSVFCEPMNIKKSLMNLRKSPQNKDFIELTQNF